MEYFRKFFYKIIAFIFDNEPNPEVVADLSIPELQDNEFEDDESRGSESISCKHNFIL